MTRDITPMPVSQRLIARIFQAAYPVITRLALTSPALQFATRKIDDPTEISIPTRHGSMRALMYLPPQGAPASSMKALPVHLLIHGGAFVVRYPEQEDNVARYLASELECAVVLPDYEVAPQRRFPIAEEQCLDAYRWILDNAEQRGWDRHRVSIGGASAGGKLALSTVLMARGADLPLPIAASLEYAIGDASIAPEARHSPKRFPIVGPWMVRMVQQTYFGDAALEEPAVSPIRELDLAGLPPLLILTGGDDTLSAEMRDFGQRAGDAGVPVTMHEFPGADHGFTHVKPVETARSAISMIGDHLEAAYRR